MNKAILAISVIFCTFPKPDSLRVLGPAQPGKPSAWPSDNWLIETTGQQGPGAHLSPWAGAPSENVSVCTQEKIQEDLHHMANSINLEWLWLGIKTINLITFLQQGTYIFVTKLGVALISLHPVLSYNKGICRD